VKLDALKEKSGAQLLSVQLDSCAAEACEFATQTKGHIEETEGR